jgi:hypothetical protein
MGLACNRRFLLSETRIRNLDAPLRRHVSAVLTEQLLTQAAALLSVPSSLTSIPETEKE